MYLHIFAAVCYLANSTYVISRKVHKDIKCNRKCVQLDTSGKLDTSQDRTIVKSLTFKEALYGPNIPVSKAMKNSTEWTETEMSLALDDIPTSDASEGPLSNPEDGHIEDNGSSSSDPVTPVRTVGGKRKAR